MTRVGGVELPGDAVGRIALDELVIHGWDVARASGRRFDCEPEALDACMAWVSQVAASEERPDGLLGAPVEVAADAPPPARLIGLSGRDPGWTPRTMP